MAQTKVKTGLVDATFGSANIADDAITAAKIVDDAITAAKIANSAVTTNKIADDAIHTAKIADDAIHTAKIADTAIHSSKLASDVVSMAKVGNEFKTISALTAATTIDVSFGTTNGASVFTLTPTSNTVLNFTNVVPGINKYMIITGTGNNYTLNYTVGGGAGTFNKISGAYDDSSNMKNLLQILCVGNSEFWYSISQIDT
jgi:hypothetical protein